MCYVSIHVFMTEMPILNYNTWNIILRFIKQWFSADLLSIVNAVNQGGKRKRGSGVGGNSKSVRIPLIPWHLSFMHHCLRFFSFFSFYLFSDNPTFLTYFFQQKQEERFYNSSRHTIQRDPITYNDQIASFIGAQPELVNHLSLAPRYVLLVSGKVFFFVCFCCAFHSLFNGPQYHDANMSSRS